MGVAVEVLRAHVVDDIDEDMTVYLHTGDPGADGTANRVPSSVLDVATITGTTHWTVAPTLARAVCNTNPDFGNARATVLGVGWYSLFKGLTLYATRRLATPMNVFLGSPVTLSSTSIVVEYTSPDS